MYKRTYVKLHPVRPRPPFRSPVEWRTGLINGANVCRICPVHACMSYRIFIRLRAEFSVRNCVNQIHQNEAENHINYTIDQLRILIIRGMRFQLVNSCYWAISFIPFDRPSTHTNLLNPKFKFTKKSHRMVRHCLAALLLLIIVKNNIICFFVYVWK